MDKKEALKIVQESGSDLVNLSDKFKKDKDVVLEAIKQDSGSLIYANEKLKEKYEINQLDGIKISINENTWSLIRKSNTEDVIRISTESNEKKLLEKIQKEMIANVKSCYEEIK